MLRAKEILDKTELKQAICQEILGCTHKDVEKAMVSIINQRKVTEEQIEQMELENIAPQKFDPEIEFIVQKKLNDEYKEPRQYNYYPATLQETQELLARNNAPVEEKPLIKKEYNYRTYTREEVEKLLKEHYEYENSEMRKKWAASQKMNELDEKIMYPTKGTKSTKPSKR